MNAVDIAVLCMIGYVSWVVVGIIFDKPKETLYEGVLTVECVDGSLLHIDSTHTAVEWRELLSRSEESEKEILDLLNADPTYKNMGVQFKRVTVND